MPLCVRKSLPPSSAIEGANFVKFVGPPCHGVQLMPSVKEMVNDGQWRVGYDEVALIYRP